MIRKSAYLLLFFVLSYFNGKACQCPFTALSMAECNKYEIIFKGRIDSIKPGDNNFSEAFFIIDELYKGNATKHFKILFDANEVCAQQFNVGDEWIIYSVYKQITNAKMNWCSRSRKYFKIDKQDFYTETYGCDYATETKFLREQLGVHRTKAESQNAAGNRNQRPTTTQTILTLICSLLFVFLFYWIVNRFLKFKR